MGRGEKRETKVSKYEAITRQLSRSLHVHTLNEFIQKQTHLKTKKREKSRIYRNEKKIRYFSMRVVKYVKIP